MKKHYNKIKKQVLPYIDILVGNLDEYKTFLRMDEIRPKPLLMLENIMRNFPNITAAILTDGSNGCYYSTQVDYGQIPSRQITVIDSTGAGDGFCAGFIHSYVNNFSFRQAIKAGIHLGSHICQGFGARFDSSNYVYNQARK